MRPGVADLPGAVGADEGLQAEDPVHLVPDALPLPGGQELARRGEEVLQGAGAAGDEAGGGHGQARRLARLELEQAPAVEPADELGVYLRPSAVR